MTLLQEIVVFVSCGLSVAFFVVNAVLLYAKRKKNKTEIHTP